MSDIVIRLRGWSGQGSPVSSTDIYAMTQEAAAEIERLREKVRNLTNLLDERVGTPCEQIRHEQEIERLTEMCQNREEFIAERGLWKEFSAWLAVPRVLEGK